MKQADRKSLGAILDRIKRLQHNHLVKLLDELDMYYGQPPILFVLWRKDGSSQTDLAQALRLTPATITAALKRMEKAELIVRKPDPEDSRISRVFLTEKGKNLQTPVEEKIMQLQNETFKNFSATEKVLLRRLLMQIEDNLTSLGEPEDCDRF